MVLLVVKVEFLRLNIMFPMKLTPVFIEVILRTPSSRGVSGATFQTILTRVVTAHRVTSGKVAPGYLIIVLI